MNFKIFLRQKLLIIFNQNSLKYLRLGIAGITAFVWWCIFYPDLCFPQDTFEVVYEADETADDSLEEAEDSIQADADSLLQVEDEQIVIKSRLFEWYRERHGYQHE